MRDTSLSQDSMATGEVKMPATVIPIRLEGKEEPLLANSIVLGFRPARRGARTRTDHLHVLTIQQYLRDELHDKSYMKCDPVFAGILLAQSDRVQITTGGASQDHLRRSTVTLCHAGKSFVLPYWEGLDMKVRSYCRSNIC